MDWGEVCRNKSILFPVSTNTLGTSQWQDNGSFHTRPGSAVSGATITVTNGQNSRPQSALRLYSLACTGVI